MRISKETAAAYLVALHGFYGGLSGDEGMTAFVKRCGCVQFDPISVCGNSPSLTFLSRVKDFDKAMYNRVIYENRTLCDYFDKQLSIIPTEDYPYFYLYRRYWSSYQISRERVNEVRLEALAIIKERGECCSDDLPFFEKVDWWWGPTRLSRAVLESLYFDGLLAISKKIGNRKYYDLAEKVLGELAFAPAPFDNDLDLAQWWFYRRVKSVGMLHNKSSDAFLGILGDIKKLRTAAFERLIKSERLTPVTVDGILSDFYVPTEYLPLLINPTNPQNSARFIAPLDNMIWDRKLIEEIFDFSYTWEIYTPKDKRKYGYYTLPVLCGNRLVGRVEPIIQNGKLILQNFWRERDFDASLLNDFGRRLANFNNCDF